MDPTAFELAAMVTQNDISITQVPELIELDEKQKAIFTRSLWLMSMSDAEYANTVDVHKFEPVASLKPKQPEKSPKQPENLSPRPPTQTPPAHLLPTSEREATRMLVRHRIRKFKSTRAQ